MQNSKIEWCHHTFNPWRGCAKISAGCANCYAEMLSRRNPTVLGIWGEGPESTRVVAAESSWREPLKWDRAAAAAGERHRVFCASLADVFEDWQGPLLAADGGILHWDGDTSVDSGWKTRTEFDPLAAVFLRHVRGRLFRLIDDTPNLDWLLLTKRPENIAKMTPVYSYHACETGDCPHDTVRECDTVAERQFRDNVWLGVSVENQVAADARIPHLLTAPAVVRFLSCEPLLGPINMTPHLTAEGLFVNSQGINCDWVIAGGESGPNARPCHPDWVRSLRDQCQAAGVPFFFKQWGEYVPGDHQDVAFSDDFQTILPWHSHAGSDTTPMVRIGKKRAGRLLDGREWNEFPRSPRGYDSGN